MCLPKAALLRMASLFVFLLVLGGQVVLPSPAFAKHSHKTRPANQAVPQTEKYAALVIDAQTGRVLFARNANAPRHPASLTKMMTLYLVFQAVENGVIKLETPLPVSAKAAAQSPSKLGLHTGQSIRAYDAIMGLVTESANDAAVVLAEALAGSTSTFADMMVRQARALGMQNTVFENPNGLPDPDQITSARDMALLGAALISHYPGFYPYFSKQSFLYKGRTYRNHNHLMERYDGMDGIKTGYIRASGFNLVASAVQGDRRLIGVIFGGKSAVSRDQQMEALLDDAFIAAKRASGNDKYLPLPSKVAVAFSSKPAAPRDTTPAPRQTTAALPNQQPPAPQQLPPQPQPDSVTPVTSGQGGWGLQVGAYSDIAAAQAALTNMASTMGDILRQSEQSLQKVTLSDGSALYRARFMGLDQNTARSACAYMVKNGHGCLVVSGP